MTTMAFMPTVRCAWRLQPSGYIAGDIFNLFPLNEDHIGFYLLDISGHGVPAAMMSVTLSMVRTPDAYQGSPLKCYDSAIGKSQVLSPGDAVRELNRRFQSRDDDLRRGVSNVDLLVVRNWPRNVSLEIA